MRPPFEKQIRSCFEEMDLGTVLYSGESGHASLTVTRDTTRGGEQQCDHAKSGPAGIISDGTPSAHVLMWPGRACCGAQAGGRA